MPNLRKGVADKKLKALLEKRDFHKNAIKRLESTKQSGNPRMRAHLNWVIRRHKGLLQETVVKISKSLPPISHAPVKPVSRKQSERLGQMMLDAAKLKVELAVIEDELNILAMEPEPDDFAMEVLHEEHAATAGKLAGLKTSIEWRLKEEGGKTDLKSLLRHIDENTGQIKPFVRIRIKKRPRIIINRYKYRHLKGPTDWL